MKDSMMYDLTAASESRRRRDLGLLFVVCVFSFGALTAACFWLAGWLLAAGVGGVDTGAVMLGGASAGVIVWLALDNPRSVVGWLLAVVFGCVMLIPAVGGYVGDGGAAEAGGAIVLTGAVWLLIVLMRVTWLVWGAMDR